MKSKISNQFLGNFWLIFCLTVVSTALAFILLSAASGLIAGSLSKNRYTAESIVKDDYRDIDASQIVKNGGGVQVLDKNLSVVFTKGLDTVNKDALTEGEFADFLADSKGKPYHYDILYHPEGEYWLIVTFPTSIRLDFGLIYNKDAARGDLARAGGVIAAVIIVYLIILAAISMVYSKITASKITVPLKKLTDGTRLLREGDYSVRVDLRLKNEFAELQNTFNDMASRIEKETALRKKSEEDRRRLILDISHDLKTPLASIQGYAELLSKKTDLPELEIIYRNSARANNLLNELFELSKMDSPDYSPKLEKTDLPEALRMICGELVARLESAGFKYDFDIPEESVYALLDTVNFGRIIQNLFDNAVRYNPEGTTVAVTLKTGGQSAAIYISDDGVGIPSHIARDIFKPFVRAEDSRSPKTGGSGLGLSIAKKIAESHGGDLVLLEDIPKGSVFRLTLPII